MNQILSWSLKVWITSVVLAPILDVLLYPIVESSTSLPGGALKFIMVMIVFSLIFTFPCWFILWRSANVIDYYLKTIIYKKVTLTVIGATLAILPFYVYFKNEPIRNDIALKSLYCITVLLGIWLYRIDPKTNSQSNEASINI